MAGRGRLIGCIPLALLVVCASGPASGQTRQRELEAQLAAEPDYVPHYLALADSYFAQGRLDDAQRMLLDAIARLGGRSESARRAGRPGARDAGLTLAPPRPVEPIAPDYPDLALTQGTGGFVAMEFTVDADGRVASPRVLTASHPMLAEATAASVLGTRFEPRDIGQSRLRVLVHAVYDPSSRHVEVAVLPARRQITGYLLAVEAHLERADRQRAALVLAAALGAVQQERQAPGQVRFVPDPRGDDQPHRAAAAIGQPVKRSGSLALYPDELRTAGIGGAVTLGATVGADGRVVSLDVTNPVEGLDRVAADAVRAWRYAPGHMNGVPVGMPVSVTLAFIPATGEVLDRVRAGADVAPPRKIHDVSPRFPLNAQLRGEQGVVSIEVVIGRDGGVRDALIRRSASPTLDAAALEAVRQWRFEPPTINGIPVEVVMTVTVRFALH